MKKIFFNIVNCLLISILFSTILFAETNQSMLEALNKMYRTRGAIKKIQKIYSPIKNRNYEIIIYKFTAEVADEKKSLPIAAIRLGNKLYFAPIIYSVDKQENLTALWSFKARNKIKINLANRNLIYGNTYKCKHSLIIFSDPECPFCRKFVPGFIDTGIANNYCVYYVDCPLDFHKHAAIYSKYLITLLDHASKKEKPEIIKKFYRTTNNPDRAKQFALSYAKKLGLTKEKFFEYIVNYGNNILINEIAMAKKAKIRGTPTLFVDFKLISNEQLDKIINFLKTDK